MVLRCYLTILYKEQKNSQLTTSVVWSSPLRWGREGAAARHRNRWLWSAAATRNRSTDRR